MAQLDEIAMDRHLSALRWLADQKTSFVMLDRDGSVLATTGPVHPSEAKLRRAQSLANETGMALCISRELIDRKLAGQAQVARDGLRDDAASEAITRLRLEIAETESIDSVRLIESQAARVYWSAWRTLSIAFPRKDLARVPEHWLSFGSRISPLTGSPRLATNPVNAMLNYLYALLESESSIAAITLGLDPSIGFLHFDTPARASLACDLMETVRSQVDAFVINWIVQQPLKREWFFEQRDGNCRLMASFATRLAETAPMWARAVAPCAEWVSQRLWSDAKRTPKPDFPRLRFAGLQKTVEISGTDSC